MDVGRRRRVCNVWAGSTGMSITALYELMGLEYVSMIVLMDE